MDSVQEYYAKTAPSKAADLEKAVGDCDRDELGRKLHKIAGSAGGFGYAELSRVARQAELLAKKAPGTELDEELQCATAAVIGMLKKLG